MQINSTTAAFEGRTYANYMQQAGYLTAYYARNGENTVAAL